MNELYSHTILPEMMSSVYSFFSVIISLISSLCYLSTSHLKVFCPSEVFLCHSVTEIMPLL